MKSTTLCILFLILPYQDVFEAKVIGVIDGDTIKVLKNGNEIRIRLNGIDCPEKSQAFGSRAKQYASDLVFGKNVKIHEKELDRYGRTIADVYVDGIWLNKALIDAGLAWHYKRFSTNEELAISETNARKNKAGLWQDPEPIAPWEFRKVNSK